MLDLSGLAIRVSASTGLAISDKGPGEQGIRESRNQGIRDSGNQEFRGSGNQGIKNQGTRESGIKNQG